MDTSAAVALVLADHEGHGPTVTAVRDLRLGLAGHAWFETYSVLTRLPPGTRRAPEEVFRLLAQDFPLTRFLSAEAAADLSEELARLGVAGGAVNDALVGATAREHGLPLVTRDRRALSVYEALGVEVRLVA
jgi:predicted nucleic acid-binding protein